MGSQKGFCVQNIKQFKEYMVREDYNYESSIRDLINDGSSVLIKGIPKSGKTRLAFEVLKNLEGYYVFSLLQISMHEIDKIIISNTTRKINLKLIWFIDDFHYFYDNSTIIYDRLLASFNEIIIVATLRSDKQLPDISIIQYLKEVNIENWSEEELIKLAASNAIPLPQQIGNTPLSLIADFSDLKRIYESYKTKEGKENCLNLLHHLKLSYEFLESINYKFLQGVFLYLRKGLSNEDDFRRALTELKNNGFLTIKEGYVFSWEPFFTEVITDNDYYMEDDMVELKTYLLNQKMEVELYHLCRYFSIKENYSLAVDILNKILEIYTNSSVDYFLRGYNYLKLNKNDFAIKDFTKAIELNPDHYYAYFERGVSYSNEGEDDLAIKDYTKAIEIDPNKYLVFYRRGSAYLLKGENDLAIKDYTKAIELNQNQYNAYFERGAGYFKKGEYDLATKDFIKAIDLNPNNQDELYYRLLLSAFLKNKNEMISNLKKIIE